jgi:hypothetical protein
VSHFFDVENVNPDLNKKAVVEDEDEAMADEKDSQSVLSDDSDASTPGRGSSRRRQNHSRKSNSKGLLKDATRRRRNAGRTQSPETTEKEVTEDEADVKAEEEEEDDSNDVQMEEAQVAPTEPVEKAKSEPQAEPVPNAQEETSEDQALNAAAAATAPVVEQLKILSIFGNNPFYCFLRLYQVSRSIVGFIPSMYTPTPIADPSFHLVGLSTPWQHEKN